jgi:hypothetical protein
MRAQYPLETRVFRTLGAVLAAGLVLVAAQVPASADDTPAPTRFSEFAITPTVVDVDHATVTYTGRLVYTDTDGVEKGLPDARVCLRKDEFCMDYTNTDADGRFTDPVTLTTVGEYPTMVEGNAGAHFQGNRDYGYALVTPGTYLHVIPAKTRISMAFDPAPSVIGDRVNVTGRLERVMPDGGSAAAPGQVVKILFQPNTAGAVPTQIAKGLTAEDGSYSVPATVPGVGFWSVETPSLYDRTPSGKGYGPYLGTQVQSSVVIANYRTTITGFNASPEPVGKGATITASGRVVRTKADGSTEPGTGSPTLQFSADGKKWKSVFSVNPDANGYFTIKTPAVSDGYWRADTTPEPGYEEFPSTSSSDYVDVRYRTRVTSFNASPEPVSKGKTITVGGNLQRYTTAWKAHSGQSVKIYFAAKGATSWTYEATAKTSSTGHFSHTFTAAKDGTWRATYAGTTTYLAVTGSGDYVDVR